MSTAIHRPVFVLGHPRTGTTHMFNLLSLNKREFTCATTFMVGFPLSFLWFEKHRWLLGNNILSEKRPMDNMKLEWDSPQEDELAINAITGLSPYMYVSNHTSTALSFSIAINCFKFVLSFCFLIVLRSVISEELSVVTTTLQLHCSP